MMQATACRAVLCSLVLAGLAVGAPNPQFTNGHLAPRNRGGSRGGQPNSHREVVAVVEESTPLEASLQKHRQVVAVVEESTPLEAPMQKQPQRDPEVIADVVEEPNRVKPKTHLQLIAEEQVRRDEELQRRAEEQVRRDEELKLRAEVELRREAEKKLLNPEVILDVVEEPKIPSNKTHAELIAEELKKRADEQIRRDEELQGRAEEQLRRDEELKRRQEHDILVQEELKRRAAAALLVQEELERRAAAHEVLIQEEQKRRAAAELLVQEELERREQAAAIVAAAAAAAAAAAEDALPQSRPSVRRPHAPRGRGGSRAPVFRSDDRFKRQGEATSEPVENQAEVGEEQLKNADALSRKEEIETEQLEKGLAHEAAGVDKHIEEAYEHEQVNREKEELIQRQEAERQKQEEDVRRLEKIRQQEERERLQREKDATVVAPQDGDQNRRFDASSGGHDWENSTSGAAHAASVVPVIVATLLLRFIA